MQICDLEYYINRSVYYGCSQLAKGLAEGRAEIALKLKNRGDSIEDISELTGLTVEEIKAL